MAKIGVEITGKDNSKQATDSAKNNIKGLDNVTNSTAKNMVANFAKIAAGVTVAVVAFKALSSTVSELTRAYAAQEQANSKLNAVLKATQYAAGFTKTQLNDMASSLEKITGYSDETITNTQALLATFKEIKGDTFKDATKAILDMSAAMGQDAKSSAIQLGKALNDPIKGVSSLSEIGVSFTEDQRRMIKSFVEANDVMSAQGVILQELQSEFGGVAEAMNNTASGALKNLTNAWTNLKETMGGVILNALKPVFEWLTDLVEGFDNLLKRLGLFDESFNKTGETVKTVSEIFIETGAISLNGFEQAFKPIFSEQIKKDFEFLQSLGLELPKSIELWGVGIEDEIVKLPLLLNRLEIIFGSHLKHFIDSIKNNSERYAKPQLEAIKQVLFAETDLLPDEFEKQFIDILEKLYSTIQTPENLPPLKIPITFEGEVILPKNIPALDVTAPGGGLGLTRGDVRSTSGLGLSFGADMARIQGILDGITQAFSNIGGVFKQLWDIAKPFLDEALSPFRDFMADFGTLLAQVIAPVLVAISPLLEVFGNALMWLANNVLIPVSNLIQRISVFLGNIVIGLANLFGSDFEKLQFDKTERIDTSFSALAAPVESTGYGATSITSRTPTIINVTFNFDAPVVGAGGIEQVGSFLVDSINQYIEAGGTAIVRGA